MLPDLPELDTADGGLTDGERRCQSSMTFAFPQPLPYVPNIGFGQCSYAVTFALCRSTFANHVLRIVGGSPEKEMFRVEARRIVAAVEDIQWAVHVIAQEERRANSMNGMDLSVDANVTVPEICLVPRPLPAPAFVHNSPQQQGSLQLVRPGKGNTGQLRH